MLSDSIYPLLAIKLHQRNQAIGINGITTPVANLLELYITNREDMTRRYSQAVYYRMMIKERVREFDKLIADVEAGNSVDDPFARGKQIELDIHELINLLETLEQETQ